MLRTQVYLPYSQVRALKEAAVKGNTSVSEIVRQSIHNTLNKKEKTKNGFKNSGEWLEYFAKQVQKSSKVNPPKDLAKNLDKYMYGEDVI